MSKPYVQTYTAVVGDKSCNANCPYCISKMTPCQEFDRKIDWRNFKRGAELASKWGATTFLITSKGEATLKNDVVLDFIKEAANYFPIIELQTNGVLLPKLIDNHMVELWKEAGLTTLAISSLGPDLNLNRKLISNKYCDPKEIVPMLKKFGYCVRLSTIMTKAGVYNVDGLVATIHFANDIGVDQLKIYPVNRPEKSENQKISDWVDNNRPEDKDLMACEDFLNNRHSRATVIHQLAHGDLVYSYQDDTMDTDQNVAFGSCLTEGNLNNEVRQLIFCSDSHIRYSWQYEAAILF